MSHCYFCDKSAVKVLPLKVDEIFVDIVPLVLEFQKYCALNDHAKFCGVEFRCLVKYHDIRELS